MRFIYVPHIIFLVSPAPVVLATNKWSDCQQKVLQIQAGELTLGSINNETLNEFLYHGPVTGLDRNFPRDKYLAVTYEGCEAICGNPVATYDAPEALSLAANWIFPLAILLNLPYESLHERKISKTLVAVLNWLGSPQTALTATIFNFRQLRESHRRFMACFGHCLVIKVPMLTSLVSSWLHSHFSCGADYNRELISRWLYNVEAVKTWASEPVNDPNNIEWWQDNTEIPQALKIDVFIGQGRKIQFCGLPHALLEASATVDFHTETNLSGCANEAANRLKGRKPKACNCYCKSSALNAPLLGGYLDFEGPAFYRDHFNVLQYWAAAAVIGGSVPTIPFIVALFWWLKCRHLWQANEGWQPQGPRGIPADTRWLL
uniref:Uncharacterized protein n=1 Tax=Fusarium oxysporum (strain Fo5176) TaxID=660025 RepID=A0A0D2XL35_FUSOF